MNTRQIATSTLWQVASQFTMAALSTIAVKCVALGLQQELAGVYNSAYGYLQFFAILSDFGLYAVSVRELSKAEDKGRVLGGLIVVRTLIMLVSLGSAVVIAFLVPIWNGTALPTSVAIASLVPAFTLLAGILRTVFQVNYKMHLVFIAEVSQRVITVGLMLLVLFSGVRASADPKYLDLFLWIGSVSALWLLILSIFFAMWTVRIRPCFDADLLKRLLKASAPYGVAFLCVALYRQSDLTMIALLRPDFELQNAYYGFVGRITEMAYLVPTFLLNSTLPALSMRHTNGEKTDTLLGKTLLALLLMGAVAAIFSFAWGRPIIRLLTTDAYLSTASLPGSDTALQVLSGPMFLNVLVLFSFYTLLTLHEWRPLVSRMIVAVVVSIGLNIVLIPQYGFMGAAATSVITHALLAALLLPVALRRLPAALPKGGVMQSVLFCGLLAIGLLMTAPLLTTDLRTAIAIVLSLVLMGLAAGGLRLHRLML